MSHRRWNRGERRGIRRRNRRKSRRVGRRRWNRGQRRGIRRWNRSESGGVGGRWRGYRACFEAVDKPGLIRIRPHYVALIINSKDLGADGTRKSDWWAEGAPAVKEPELRAVAQLVKPDNVAKIIDVRGHGCGCAGEINGGESASVVQEALLRCAVR